MNKSEYCIPDGSENAFSQELIAVIQSNYIVLILGPIVIALATFAVLLCLPNQYTSAAYLSMDREASRSFMTIVTSPAVVDKVLGRYPDAGTTMESRTRYLTQRIALTDTKPLPPERADARTFIFEVTAGDAQEAQEINSHLIDAWVATSVLSPTRRTYLENQLKRNSDTADATSALLARLQKDVSGPLTIPQADLTSNLIRRLDESQASINDVKKQLASVPNEPVQAPPNLPQEPAHARKGVAILAGLLSIPFILALLVFVRFLSEGRPA